MVGARRGESVSFVRPLRQGDMFEVQRLLMQAWRLIRSAVFPGGDERELVVVTQCLAIRRLVLDAEVATAGFLPLQRVHAHQLRQLEEIGYPSRLLE